MRVAPDTNRLTGLFQGDSVPAEQLGLCQEVWLPLVVLAEIKAGFYGGSQQHLNKNPAPTSTRQADRWVLLPDHETAEHYARLFVQLKRAGTPVPATISGSPPSTRACRPVGHQGPAFRAHPAIAARLVFQRSDPEGTRSYDPY